MLHVSQPQGAIPDAILRAMFAARKSVFVDLLKWDVPVIHGRYEVDQFDDPNATYLVLTTSEGGHLGSARLLPTTRAHILGSLYPELCDGAVPSDQGVMEVTRFCLDRSLRASERRQVRDALVTALAHHALANGIRRYTAVAEIGWVQQILAFGWRCRPLGLPREINGSTLAALSILIDPDTPARLAAAGIAADATLLGIDHRHAA